MVYLSVFAMFDRKALEFSFRTTNTPLITFDCIFKDINILHL